MESAIVDSLKREIVEILPESTGPAPFEKRLGVETGYYEGMGVSFMLRRGHGNKYDLLAHLSLCKPPVIHHKLYSVYFAPGR